MNTSCYFWLPCRFLNFKRSLVIFQRATLSNQCTSLRKLHLHSGLCGLLMAALHIFLFPHFHSKCLTTNSGMTRTNIYDNIVLICLFFRKPITKPSTINRKISSVSQLTSHNRSYNYLNMYSIYLCNISTLCKFIHILNIAKQ